MSDERTSPETVTATIDGVEVTVPKGTTILEAAESLGTRVPHYCYHPGLSSPAQCRLCLVEVEGAPKLQPACVTAAQDGQVVHTQSDPALEMRKGVLEFYLVNHPLDCPICDQSGECKLQDYVHAEGRAHGRSREPKRVFGRDDFGGDVLFYGDRCVMCTRCVRFMNEVEKDPRLTVVERGDRSIIDTFFEEGLDGTRFHGNIVDICPVGALVSKDFLHKQRAWDLKHVPSICPNCSQGCNIELHTRDNAVQRLKPRENLDVNGHWICDFGRLGYEWINAPGRVEQPARLEGGSLSVRSWDQAVLEIAEALTGVTDSGGAEVVGLAAPTCSNEELGALAALLRTLGDGGRYYRSRRADEEWVLEGFPQLARRRDLAPNTTGAELLGFTRVGDDDGAGGLDPIDGADIVIIVGDELSDLPARPDSVRLVVHLTSAPSPEALAADFVLPLATFAEQDGTFTNHEGRVQRFRTALVPPGEAMPGWAALSSIGARLGAAEASADPGEAFARLAETSAAFAGLTLESLGMRGALVNEPLAIGGGAS